MTRSDHIVYRFQETMGNSWWWRRKADLIDRKREDGTYKPFDYNANRFSLTHRNILKYGGSGPIEVKQPYVIKPVGDIGVPPMMDRPVGMTRQTQRRLYRESCKVAGVPWKKPRVTKTPRRLRGMTAVQRALWEEAEWQKFKAEHVKFLLEDGTVVPFKE